MMRLVRVSSFTDDPPKIRDGQKKELFPKQAALVTLGVELPSKVVGVLLPAATGPGALQRGRGVPGRETSCGQSAAEYFCTSRYETLSV